jgi:hypothetical protein
MKLSKDFQDLLKLLNLHSVRYLVVGGYATSVHAVPRYTKDIDLWMDRSPENAQALMRALEAFGFGSLGLQASDFLADDTIVQLGYEPNRVDLLTSLKGVEFGECYDRRLEAEVEGINLPFIAALDLITNKSSVGRTQDVAENGSTVKRTL